MSWEEASRDIAKIVPVAFVKITAYLAENANPVLYFKIK